MAGGLIEPPCARAAQHFGIDRNSWPYRTFQTVRTLAIIFVGELFFRSNSLEAGLAMMGRIADDFTIEAFTTGSALQIGFGVGDGLIVTLFMMLVLAVGVVKERGCNLCEWATAQSALLRWSLVILLFVGTVTFGAYGLGYTPVDPMSAPFAFVSSKAAVTPSTGPTQAGVTLKKVIWRFNASDCSFFV